MKVSSAVLLFSLSSLTAAAVAAKDNDNLKSSVAGQPANLMVDRFKSKAKDTIFGRKAVSRPASGGGVVGEEQQSSPSSSPATLVTTPSAPPAKLPSSPACDGRWVIRKEIRQMKQDGDFDGFVKAFKQMATDGSLQQLVTWHKYQGTRYMHGQNPRFLPWHRIYLNKFEEELTKRGAKYLPYWDWTIDANNIHASPILSAEYFGSPDPNNNYYLKDSAFKHGEYTCPDTGKPITRYYDPATDHYNGYSAWHIQDIQTKTSFSEFCHKLNAAHGTLHFAVGNGHAISKPMGTMTNIAEAPQDPTFWLHHAFIDKIWNGWQNMGHKRDYDTNSFDAEFRDIKINDPMEPFPERPTLLQGYELEEKCITYDNQPAHVQEGPVETPDLPPDEILEKHGINKTEAEADAKNLTNKANEKISEENNNNKTNVTTIGPVKPPAKKDDDKNGASMLALASSSSSVLSLSVAVALIFSAIV